MRHWKVKEWMLVWIRNLIHEFWLTWMVYKSFWVLLALIRSLLYILTGVVVFFGGMLTWEPFLEGTKDIPGVAFLETTISLVLCFICWELLVRGVRTMDRAFKVREREAGIDGEPTGFFKWTLERIRMIDGKTGGEEFYQEAGRKLSKGWRKYQIELFFLGVILASYILLVVLNITGITDW